MTNCPNCGAAFEAGWSKCEYCGTARQASAAYPTPPVPRPVAPLPPAPPNQFGPPVAIDAKSKIAAGLLGILLGALGIHNFYLGYTGKGLAQLLITVLSCGYLAIVSWVWGLVEGIMILTGSIAVDAGGVPLRD